MADRPLRRLGFVILLIASCGSERPPSEARDATARDGTSPSDAARTDATSLADGGGADASVQDAGGAWIEIGTGAGAFEPIGSTPLALNLGPQGGGRYGGYNLWVSVRGHGLEAGRVELEVVAEDAASGARLSHVSYQAEITDSELELNGLPVILEDCCLAEGREIAMRVEVGDSAGQSVTGEVRGRAAPLCAPPPGESTDICP